MFQSVKALIYIDGLLLIGIVFYRWALAPQFKRMVDTRIVALVLLTPPALMFSPNLAVAYILIAFAAMTARTRTELCAGYLLMLPLVPELSFEYRYGGAFIGRFSAVLALGAGALLAYCWAKRTGKLSRGKYDVAAAALVILFTLISARGGPPAAYLRAFIDQFLSVVPPYVLVSRGIGREDDARRVLSRFYLAGVLCALIAVFEATRRWALYDSIPGNLGIPTLDIAVLNVRAGFMRSGGPFLNPTALAFFLAILPAGLWGVRSYFSRVGYIAVTGVLLTGLLATQSRGAWLACAAAYCALWALRGKKGRAVGAVVTGGTLFALASSLLPDNGRLAESLGRTGAAAATGDYRRSMWDSGLSQVRTHPWLGQSIADLKAAMSNLVQGQGIVDFVNTHLFVTMATGLAGLTIWFAIWAVPIHATLLRGAPVLGRHVSDVRAVPATILVASMVALFFTSTTNRGLAWPVIALGLAAPATTLMGRSQKNQKVGADDSGAATGR